MTISVGQSESWSWGWRGLEHAQPSGRMAGLPVGPGAAGVSNELRALVVGRPPHPPHCTRLLRPAGQR